MLPVAERGRESAFERLCFVFVNLGQSNLGKWKLHKSKLACFTTSCPLAKAWLTRASAIFSRSYFCKCTLYLYTHAYCCNKNLCILSSSTTPFGKLRSWRFGNLSKCQLSTRQQTFSFKMTHKKTCVWYVFRFPFFPVSLYKFQKNSKRLQKSSKKVPNKFQKSSKKVLKKFQKSSKKVPKKFQKSSKKVPQKFQKVPKLSSKNLPKKFQNFQKKRSKLSKKIVRSCSH